MCVISNKKIKLWVFCYCLHFTSYNIVHVCVYVYCAILVYISPLLIKYIWRKKITELWSPNRSNRCFFFFWIASNVYECNNLAYDDVCVCFFYYEKIHFSMRSYDYTRDKKKYQEKSKCERQTGLQQQKNGERTSSNSNSFCFSCWSQCADYYTSSYLYYFFLLLFCFHVDHTIFLYYIRVNIVFYFIRFYISLTCVIAHSGQRKSTLNIKRHCVYVSMRPKHCIVVVVVVFSLTVFLVVVVVVVVVFVQILVLFYSDN